MFRRLTIILLLTLNVLSLAQSQSNVQKFYQHFAGDLSLVSDKTTTVIEDYLGFIWIGTEEGLSKIVDYGIFITYKNDRKDSTTLSDNHVNVLFEDSKQRFWVGTKDGLNLYNRKLNTFQRINIPHEDKESGRVGVNGIREDESGDLWIICNGHLFHLFGTSLKEKNIYHAPSINGEVLQITDFAIFKSKKIAATSKGLFEVIGTELIELDWVGDKFITSVLPLGNELWLGTQGNGIAIYDYIRKRRRILNMDSKQTPLSSNYINHIYKFESNEVWVSTIDGVTAIDLETEESRFIKHDFLNSASLSDKIIRNVYQDRTGVNWITTANSGINFAHDADNLFQYYGQTTEKGTENDLMDYAILSVFSHDGQTWLGSRKGLSVINDRTGKFKHYPMPEPLSNRVNSILSITHRDKANLWLGTNRGLLSFNSLTETYESVLPDVLNDIQINAMLVDKSDNLWLGTSADGVKLYSASSGLIRNAEILTEGGALSYIPSIESIIKAESGDILVGTEKGLFRLKGRALERVEISSDSSNLLDEVHINEVYESKRYGVMLATEQDGLLLLDSALRFSDAYDLERGMSSNDLRSVVEDPDGILWISSNSGITKLWIDLQDSSKTTVRKYSQNDGLQSDQFSKRAGGISNNEKILFGGLSGATAFHPDDVIDFKISQKINFLSLIIDGKLVRPTDDNSPLKEDISITDKIVLNSQQNSFNLRFSTIDYIRPTEVVYRYKLKGYHNDWINDYVYAEITFENIPGGKDYELVVQSKGRFSEWSKEKKLIISIQPHFYETVWFKALVVLAILGLIVLVFKLRNRRTVAKRRELEALVKERSVKLTDEISERKRTEQKLHVALTEAERANEIKSSFLANMSHEIRTPLNGIMGLTQLSLENEVDEEQKEILNTLATSANSLKAIVDDILDIAKIEAGTMDFASEVFSVKDLLEEVVSSFRTMIDEKGLYLKKWVLPTIPNLVLGDVDRVRQILVNLVSNAIKFTHKGGVTILAEGLDQGGDRIEVWFTVTDTGIGMPEAQLNRIFESFTQVDSGDTRAYGGTGLGLSICKDLVGKMGGEIWAESDEGSGSIFKFYIKAEEIFEEDRPGTDKEFEEELPEEFAQNTLKCVLLIEDNSTNQMVARKMLERNNIEVLCAKNGLEGLEKVKEKNFDLVLMDLQMPEMDGYETTKNIRGLDREKSKIPIVALTAAAMVGEKEKCLKAGMNDYLSKPVNYDLLIKTVNKYLNLDLEEQNI